eukprot:6407914-Alexandrium_andersonii.AAC.1
MNRWRGLLGIGQGHCRDAVGVIHRPGNSRESESIEDASTISGKHRDLTWRSSGAPEGQRQR